MVVNLTRDREYLYFDIPEKTSSVRFNLSTKVMESNSNRNKLWIEKDQCYSFFKGHSIDSIVVSNEKDIKFLEMVKKVKRLYRNCSSLSTFIIRLSEILAFESYDNEGIKYECGTNWSGKPYIIHEPLSIYDKHVIKLFKKAKNERYGNEINFVVSIDFENQYKNHKTIIDKTANIICSNMFLSEQQIYDFLNMVEKNPSSFIILVNEYKYDIKALLDYLFNYLEPFENVKIRDALTELSDYYRMGKDVGRELKKYPKYLKSMHGIIMANYNAYKQEYDEALFEKKKRNELFYEDKEYSIILPSSSKDIISEGTSLNHCVSSYVDKILKGDTYIIFLRKTENKEQSLVTLEIHDKKIVQARGSYNRALEECETKFLIKYAEEKKLEITI